MRKPAFLHKKTKALVSYPVTAQLISGFIFLFIDSTSPLLPKSVTIFFGCTARFVSDLVGSPKDKLSHDAAKLPFHIL